jgi:hypothetical protein
MWPRILFPRLWRRMPLYVKAGALVLGAAVLGAWCVLAVVGIVVWYESPLYCPPTMGCPALSTQGCRGGGVFGRHDMDSSWDK